MATFFIFPSREMLGQRYGDMLSAVFPGVIRDWDWLDLVESLSALVEGQGGAFVVYRDDLDEELGLRESLARNFGAQRDDEVIEVAFGADLHQIKHKRWSMGSERKAA